MRNFVMFLFCCTLAMSSLYAAGDSTVIFYTDKDGDYHSCLIQREYSSDGSLSIKLSFDEDGYKEQKSDRSYELKIFTEGSLKKLAFNASFPGEEATVTVERKLPEKTLLKMLIFHKGQFATHKLNKKRFGTLGKVFYAVIENCKPVKTEGGMGYGWKTKAVPHGDQDKCVSAFEFMGDKVMLEDDTLNKYLATLGGVSPTKMISK